MFVFQTATTRPVRLAQPFPRWSIRKLAAYLRTVHGWGIRIGCEACRLYQGPSCEPPRAPAAALGAVIQITRRACISEPVAALF